MTKQESPDYYVNNVSLTTPVMSSTVPVCEPSQPVDSRSLAVSLQSTPPVPASARSVSPTADIGC